MRTTYRNVLFLLIPLLFLYPRCSGPDSEGDTIVKNLDNPGSYREVTTDREDFEPYESDWFHLESFDIDTASTTGPGERTKIQCKLFLPGGKPPYPCLMVAHGWPGQADSDMVMDWAYMLRDRGYACLIWSARGYGTSTELARGNTFDHEIKDAIRLINWLGEQDFVIPDDGTGKEFENGQLVDFDFNNDGVQEEDDIPGDESKDFRLGMYGGSYGGGIQLLTASFDRRIDAITPIITWNDLYQSFAPDDNLKLLYCSFFLLGGMTQANTAIDPMITEWVLTGLMTGEPSLNMIEGGRKRSPATRIEKIQAPACVIQGQLDNVFDLNQGVANFESIRDNGIDAKMYWYRGGHTGPTRDPEAVKERAVTWLDHYLKDDSIDTGPEFEYDSRDASGEWSVRSGSWPLMEREEETVFYLHSDGETGRLSVDDGESGPDYSGDIIFDSLINKPFISTSYNDIMVSDLEKADALVFDSPLTSFAYETDVFDEDTEITGMPRIDIWLSSSCHDITFFFKVYDVAPDGRANLIDINVTPKRLPGRDSEDNIRANIDEWLYDNPLFQEMNDAFFEYVVRGMDLEMLLAGIPMLGVPRRGNLELPELYSFDLRAFTHVFAAGHRLRLTVATSHLGYMHSRQIGKGFIWHGNDYVSKVSFPVLKQ